MEEQTLNELKQIKLQDQIRDMEFQSANLKRKRRRTIGYILEVFLFLLLITMTSDIPYFFSIFWELLDPTTRIDYSFSPGNYWYWLIGIGFVLQIFLVIRILNFSQKISELQLGISKRIETLTRLEGNDDLLS